MIWSSDEMIDVSWREIRIVRSLGMCSGKKTLWSPSVSSGMDKYHQWSLKCIFNGGNHYSSPMKRLSVADNFVRGNYTATFAWHVWHSCDIRVETPAKYIPITCPGLFLSLHTLVLLLSFPGYPALRLTFCASCPGAKILFGTSTIYISPSCAIFA